MGFISKKGQGKIIVVILLILLVLALIGILWGSLFKIIVEEGDEISLPAPIMFTANINSVNLRVNNSIAEVVVKRGVGRSENISGVKLIFEGCGGDKNYFYDNKTNYPNILESKIYLVSNDTLGIQNFSCMNKVSVAYFYEKNGDDALTPVLDVSGIRETIRSTSPDIGPGGPDPGDETCDCPANFCGDIGSGCAICEGCSIAGYDCKNVDGDYVCLNSSANCTESNNNEGYYVTNNTDIFWKGCSNSPPITFLNNYSCVSDASHVINDLSYDCNDSVWYNGSETCDIENSVCLAGTITPEDDSVMCTEDIANITSIIPAWLHIANDSRCNDTNVCNGEETCDVDEGCKGGTVMDCLSDCTEDVCSDGGIGPKWEDYDDNSDSCIGNACVEPTNCKIPITSVCNKTNCDAECESGETNDRNTFYCSGDNLYENVFECNTDNCLFEELVSNDIEIDCLRDCNDDVCNGPKLEDYSPDSDSCIGNACVEPINCNTPVITCDKNTCEAECESGETNDRNTFYCSGDNLYENVFECNTDNCLFEELVSNDIFINNCNDGYSCTGIETCSGGACQGGTPESCDDINVCTIDSCIGEGGDDGTGCNHAPITGGYCDAAQDKECINGVCTDIPCMLLQATWGQYSAGLNDEVTLDVLGDFCTDKKINFTIYKKEGLFGIDWLWPDSVVFETFSFATTNWNAGEPESGDSEAGEYYFEAELEDGSDQISSKDVYMGNLIVYDCITLNDCTDYPTDEDICNENVCGVGMCGWDETSCVELLTFEAHWTMDEDEGGKIFDINRNYPGDLINDVIIDSDTTREGKVAIFPDGSGDYIDFGNILPFNTFDEFTWSFWAKRSITESDLISKGEFGNAGYSISFGMGNNLIFYGFGDRGTQTMDCSSGYIPTNVWTHIVVVQQWSKIKGYVNGVECGERNLNKVNGNDFSNFVIGTGATFNPKGSSSFKGSIDDVMVFNEVLSEGNINYIYCSQKVGGCP